MSNIDEPEISNPVPSVEEQLLYEALIVISPSPNLINHVDKSAYKFNSHGFLSFLI